MKKEALPNPVEQNEPAPQRRIYCRMLVAAAAACALLLTADVVMRVVWTHTQLARQIVDIQTPSILELKLDALERHKGLKVVLLGDSLVYGRAMENHGDEAWRRHTLSALLEQKLRQALPASAPLVMNLALNGAVPADLEQLARRIAPCKPDLVIANLNLRSFSTDFSEPDALFSRPWLDDSKAAASDSKQSPAGRLGGFVEKTSADFMRRFWMCYAARDCLQYRLLDGTPQAALRRLRNRLNDEGRSRPGADFADMVLMMKVRRRYATANLRPDNPQCAALKRMLSFLQKNKMKTILFYGQEDRERLEAIVPAERYAQLRSDLKSLIEPFLNGHLAYIPGPDTISPDHYFDYVHIDKKGYEMLLNTLWPQIEAWTCPATRPGSD